MNAFEPFCYKPQQYFRTIHIIFILPCVLIFKLSCLISVSNTINHLVLESWSYYHLVVWWSLSLSKNIRYCFSLIRAKPMETVAFLGISNTICDVSHLEPLNHIKNLNTRHPFPFNEPEDLNRSLFIKIYFKYTSCT